MTHETDSTSRLRASGRSRVPDAARLGAAVTAAIGTASAAAGLLLVVAGPSVARATTRSTQPSSGLLRWGDPGHAGPVKQLQLDSPTAVAGIPARAGPLKQIVATDSDGYALTFRGAVYAWGNDAVGQLGDGVLTAHSRRAVRVRFPAGVRITSLPNPAPFEAALAMDSHGHLYGWGNDVAGDLCHTGPAESRPKRLPLSGVTKASGAGFHTLFEAHGRVYACGDNSAGELGNGTTTSSPAPTPVSGLPAGRRITTLTSSFAGSGALLSDGAYYDWGLNAAGQLGDRTTADSTRPVEVQLPRRVAQVFQGGSNAMNGQSIALLRGGSVYTWGDNTDGQLGDGTTTDADAPVRLRIPRGVRFTTVASGGADDFALDRGGHLWSWGDNTFGQLGLGSAGGMRTRPTRIPIRLRQISATSRNVEGLSLTH